MNATARKRISQSIRMMQHCRPMTAKTQEWKTAMLQRLEVEQLHVIALDGEQAGLVALVDFAVKYDRRKLYQNMLVAMYQNPDNLEEAVSAASRSRLNEWLDVPACEFEEFEEVKRMFWTANHIALGAVKQRLLDEFDMEIEHYDDFDMPL